MAPTPWAILNPDIQAGVIEFINATSDRICALVGAAVVDEALRQALSYRLRDCSTREKVIEHTGSLGEFGAKAQVGYLLYMYERDEYSALRGIGEVRNLFAHRLLVSDFDDKDEKLAAAFERFKLHGTYKKLPLPFSKGDSEYDVPPTTKRRDIFITNIQILLVILMRDLSAHLPNSNVPAPLPKPSVPPSEPSPSPETRAQGQAPIARNATELDR